MQECNSGNSYRITEGREGRDVGDISLQRDVRLLFPSLQSMPTGSRPGFSLSTLHVFLPFIPSHLFIFSLPFPCLPHPCSLRPSLLSPSRPSYCSSSHLPAVFILPPVPLFIHADHNIQFYVISSWRRRGRGRRLERLNMRPTTTTTLTKRLKLLKQISLLVDFT